MIKDKRGAELSMNVIIISILVILVLVVVATFFISGSSSLFSKIKEYSPSNLGASVQDCESKCQLAQTFDSDVAKRTSSYCKKEIKVDTNDDNRADQVHHCWSSEIGVECPDVQNKCNVDAYEDLET
ncbi:MAG: hypothetical protein ISS82_02865 [Nanoarchaeota archaeon]|nr:hypothetical protein [Nanoarchaeota archaeon]